MRLRTCIVLELAVCSSILTGLGFGAAWGVGAAREYAAVHEGTALASTTRIRPEPVAALTTPRPEPDVPPPVATDVDAGAADPATAAAPPDGGLGGPEALATAPDAGAPSAPDNVFGTPDGDLLAPLRGDAAVTRVKLNRGGTSLSLRLDFDNGARAAFKPEQVFTYSNPRREIAAYRVDRLLGLGKVPPATARRFKVADLMAVLDPSMRNLLTARLKEQAVARDGAVSGEVSWWVPVITDAKIRQFRIDETDGIVSWRRLLRAGAKIPAHELFLVQQISDMVLFDFIIDNLDRWSGSNTKASPDGKTLYFMDNTMSFSIDPDGRRNKSRLYLERVQTFSRRLVTRLRALDADAVRAAVVPDPGSPLPVLLTRDEITAFLGRRDTALAYIDDLIKEHGEDVVLAFP